MTRTSRRAPRLVLMCGPAGAGKSTHARRLEAEGFVRCSIDDLAWAEGRTAHPLPDDVAHRVAADLLERVGAQLEKGHDVVVDSSFWSRSSREEYRRLGAAHGVVAEVLYVSTPREVALARVAARAGEHADDVLLTAEVAAAFYDGFQIPTPEEGALTVVEGC